MRVKFLAISLCLITVIPGFPLEVFVNGKPAGDYSYKDLEALSYLVPTAGGTASSGSTGLPAGYAPGFSLIDIVPPMVDIFRLDVHNPGGRSQWINDSLADELSEYTVQLTGGFWSINLGGLLYLNVDRLDVWGTPLEKKELEVWVSWEGTRILKEEIGRYSLRHELDIRVVEVPKTSTKLISVLRGGGTPPDVVMVQSSDIFRLVQARALQNLGYLVKGHLTGKGIEAFRFDGKQWGIPMYGDVQLVYFNPDLLKIEADGDWTLNDLEAQAEQVLGKHDGVVPMAWNAYSAYWLIPFLYGFGKEELIAEDGSIRIDDTPMEQAIGYLVDLKERGLLEYMERDAMISQFVSGRIGMILSGSYSIPLFTELGIPFDVAPFPVHPETGDAVSPMLDFKALAISRKSRNPMLARRLVQYLTGIGIQQRFPVSLSKLPSNRLAWSVAEANNAYYPVLRASADLGVVVPVDPSYDIFKNTMWKILRLSLSGQMEVSEMLKNGQDIINKQLEESRRE